VIDVPAHLLLERINCDLGRLLVLDSEERLRAVSQGHEEVRKPVGLDRRRVQLTEVHGNKVAVPVQPRVVADASKSRAKLSDCLESQHVALQSENNKSRIKC